MYNIITLAFAVLFQQGTNAISPDGRFRVTVETNEEHDLQARYIIKLTDAVSKETIEIANCIRRDLPAPNYYWDKDSRYLIFEQCAESFANNKIKILNLKTTDVEYELTGIIGNKDDNSVQFDQQIGLLFYFATSNDSNSGLPELRVFTLATRESRKLFDFPGSFDMEFPTIERTSDKREITLTYTDKAFNQQIRKVRY